MSATSGSQSTTLPPDMIVRRLRDIYGSPRHQPATEPVEELVKTILSQNTTDRNTDRAYQSLRRRFRTWDAVADAPADDVVEAIRSGGLANQKGPRIQRILQGIRESQGDYDLRFLNDMPVEEAWNWLTGLSGVGPKTAACVLLFSLELPVLPVDTHVHRVTMRLGLIPPHTSAEKAHQMLADTFEPDDRYDAHMLLIQHGRQTCLAQNPRCASCVLCDDCPSADVFLAGEKCDSKDSTH